jgi:hypothetical protein
MSKPWDRKSNYKRNFGTTRHIRNRILILCEGEKTEPNYFSKFPVDITLVRIDVEGDGANTLRLVEDAIRRGNEAASKHQQYNQIWCVFDRDSFPAKNFNQAFKVAEKNKIRIAYSNQCIELWFLLHYHFFDSAIDRKDYIVKLSEAMGQKYEKNDDKMYALLKNKQSTAIKNARNLSNRYLLCNPEKDNPSTNVQDLVEALNKFIK